METIIRARDLGIPFDGEPGPHNAITDVPGIALGHCTLIAGHGPLDVGRGPVRTGVTAILPRPVATLTTPLFAGVHTLNGNGEMSGCHMIVEAGLFAGPVTITNTHACGIARDATIAWLARIHPAGVADAWALPVAAETYDGFLSDMNGGHVRAEHVVAAIEAAADGPVAEGGVGGGTGMTAFGFKAGAGTASRRVGHGDRRYTLGVFVQANFGRRRQLMIRGVRVGVELAEPSAPAPEKSSIIGIVATDAPLLGHQCARLARRMPLGVAWTGGIAHHGSGDIFLAFSTANIEAATARPGTLARAEFVPDADLDPLFDAVVQATEEAILNALVAGRDMTGRDGHFVPGLPLDWVCRRFG